MFKWLKKLFARCHCRSYHERTGEHVEACPKHEEGPDIVARQGGQKRNRVHLYRQPFGYPIRACDWQAVSVEDLESATDEDTREPYSVITCRHCQAIVQGKRFDGIMVAKGGARL